MNRLNWHVDPTTGVSCMRLPGEGSTLRPMARPSDGDAMEPGVVSRRTGLTGWSWPGRRGLDRPTTRLRGDPEVGGGALPLRSSPRCPMGEWVHHDVWTMTRTARASGARGGIRGIHRVCGRGRSRGPGGGWVRFAAVVSRSGVVEGAVGRQSSP